MRVSLLYCEECPSYDRAFERVRKILREEGIRAELEVIKVDTDDEAERRHFIGSPTILIDGKDIDPAPKGSTYRAQACRAYRLEDGRISPLPSEEMVRRAIRTAIENFKRL